MDEWSMAASQLVVAGRKNSARCLRRERAGELVRVFRNVYVAAAYLVVPDRWQLALRVNLARACAVAFALGPRVAVSHETAAVMYGVPTLGEFVDVHVAIGRRWGGRGGVLPAILLPGQPVIPAVRLHRHESAVGASDVMRRAKVTVVHPVVAAVQCARSLHPREGTVVVSGLLRKLSRFDRFHMEESRAREEQWRSQMMSVLVRQGSGARNSSRGRSVLAAADAGCESVPEALLVWALKAAGFTGVRTQVEHRAGESRYHVDVEIEGSNAALEFDGKLKYGADREEVLANMSRQNRRQKDLESLGLVVMHFEFRELEDWKAIRDEVLRKSDIRRCPRPNRVLLAGR